MKYFTQEYQDRFMAGETTVEEDVLAMSELIQLKEHWKVRGYYRRLAQTMIDGGWIADEGTLP
jgi:hypothetical protein